PRGRRGGPRGRAGAGRRLALPLDQLHRYRSELSPPPDLTEFWRDTLSLVDRSAPTFVKADSGLVVLESYDVTFAGFGGHPIRAWLHLPATAARVEPLPGVVPYMGYNGGRGRAPPQGVWARPRAAHPLVATPR